MWETWGRSKGARAGDMRESGRQEGWSREGCEGGRRDGHERGVREAGGMAGGMAGEGQQGAMQLYMALPSSYMWERATYMNLGSSRG